MNEEMTLNKKAWLRYFARVIDINLGIILLGFIFGIILEFIKISGYLLPEIPEIPEFIMVIAIMTVYFFIESLILSNFGTTPGKKIFGISIVNSDEKKLTYLICLKRGLLLWTKAFALSIPIIKTIALALSYSKYTSEGITSWDKTCNTLVVHKKIGSFRFVVGIIICSLDFIFDILAFY